jgi:hypothetical protein
MLILIAERTCRPFKTFAITHAERLARWIALVDAQPGALAAHIAGSLKAAAMREHGPSGQADPFKVAIRPILDVEVLAKKEGAAGWC